MTIKAVVGGYQSEINMQILGLCRLEFGIVENVYFAKSMIDCRDERWDNVAQRVE